MARELRKGGFEDRIESARRDHIFQAAVASLSCPQLADDIARGERQNIDVVAMLQLQTSVAQHLRNGQIRATLGNLTYYCFIGQSDITASHLTRSSIDLRDRILKGYNQRWAYVTVAAIVTEGWTHPSRTEEETAAVMEEFMRLLVLELKRPGRRQTALAGRLVFRSVAARMHQDLVLPPRLSSLA